MLAGPTLTESHHYCLYDLYNPSEHHSAPLSITFFITKMGVHMPP